MGGDPVASLPQPGAAKLLMTVQGLFETVSLIDVQQAITKLSQPETHEHSYEDFFAFCIELINAGAMPMTAKENPDTRDSRNEDYK